MTPESMMALGVLATILGFCYGYHRGWQDGQSDLRERIYEAFESDGR